jgi:hypothetical protein
MIGFLILNAGRDHGSADTGPQGGAFDSLLASSLGEVYRAQMAKMNYQAAHKFVPENVRPKGFEPLTF